MNWGFNPNPSGNSNTVNRCCRNFKHFLFGDNAEKHGKTDSDKQQSKKAAAAAAVGVVVVVVVVGVVVVV